MDVPAEPGVGGVLFDAASVAARVDEIGATLARQLKSAIEYASAAAHRPEPGALLRVVLLAALTGAVVFAADPFRRIELPVEAFPVTVRSAPGAATESQGAPPVGGFPGGLAGRGVVLVDGVVDAGRTLAMLAERARAQGRAQGPASVRPCVLLEKPAHRRVRARVGHAGFPAPGEFLVGYGLDSHGRYGNLDGACALGMDGASYALGMALGGACGQKGGVRASG